MKPIKCGDLPWDGTDERHEGITGNELMGNSTGTSFRLVTYQDPETGKLWKFITSDLTLPPGIIAHLYRMRWNIEKVFDETKNKLHEAKGWGISENATRLQAHFVALAHNLLMLFEAKVEREHGIRDEKVEKKYNKELQARARAARKKGRRLPRMIKLLRQPERRSSAFNSFAGYAISPHNQGFLRGKPARSTHRYERSHLNKHGHH